MEQVYENKSLSFREKKNKVGRFFLYLGTFISVAMTFFIMFLLVINSVGISPSDQYGFKLVRNDIGQEIASSYQIEDTKSKLQKGEFEILKDNSTVYYVKFEKTDNTRDLNFDDGVREIKLSINIEDKTIHSETNLDTKITTIEEGLKIYDEVVNAYFDKFAFYNSSFYQKLIKHEQIRYFYNEEKKFLKTGLDNSNYVISNSAGIIVEGMFDASEDPQINEFYKFNFKN